MNLEYIAQKAGVSRSTVSRVINNEPYVSDKTREKVMAVVNELGFTPNPVARSLVTRRTNIISVVIPGTISAFFNGSLYFPPLLKGIARATSELDYTMLLWIDQEERSQAMIDPRVIQNSMADGFIVISPTMDGKLIKTLIDHKVHFVSVDRTDYLDPKTNFVTVENVESVRQAVNYLGALGHKRIACVTGSVTIIDVHDRLEGYRLGLQDLGLPYDEDIVYSGEFTYESGIEAAEFLKDKHIDAIFAQLDTVAAGIITKFEDYGIRVPDDIAIIGFDDLIISQNIPINLTTIRQPIEDKGYEATKVLIDLIKGNITEPVHRFLPTQLIIRETCGGSIKQYEALEIHDSKGVI